MPKQQEHPPDNPKLKVLVRLRKACKITQAEQAQILGLVGSKSRDTISSWEKGRETPPENKWRQPFISYLLDNLGLRQDPAQFLEVWDVLISEWGWGELNVRDQERFLQPAIDKNPYRGLEAFTEADANNFFGRDEQIVKLKQVVQRQQMLVMFGSSGSGKTSIIQAGLIPILRQDQWIIVQMRPGRQPFLSLAEGMLAAAYPNHSENGRRAKASKLADNWLRASTTVLQTAQALPHFADATHCLLIVDQFEELFTICQDPQVTERFICDLLALTEHSNLPAKLLLAIRADFYDEVVRVPALSAKLNEGHYSLPVMSQAQLEAAILQPARALFTRFEEGLLSRILLDVGDSPGKLTLLEFALTQLWEHPANKAGLLTLDAYNEIGRVQGALINYAEEVFNGLDTTEQQQAARLFLQLVKPSKRHKTTRILASRTKLGSANWALATKLADSRLIVTGKDGREQAEIIHEALIETWPRLANWIDQSRDFRIWQEDLNILVDQWQAMGYDEGVLLRGAPFATAVKYLDDRGDELSLPEQDFINASIALHEEETAARQARLQKEQKATLNLRRRAIYLAVALLAVVILAIAAVNFGQQSKQEAQNARAELSNSLARQAHTLYTSQPRLALLLAAEAVKIPIEENDPRPTLAEETLREGLEQLYGYGLMGHESTITSSVFSPNGRWLATASFDNTVRLFDLTASDFPSIVLRGHTAPILNIAISTDGRWLASVSNDKTARLWDLHSSNPAANSVLLVGHQKIVGSVAFSPNGRWLATGSADATVFLWDISATDPADSPIVLSGHSGSVNSIAFSPDNAWLATGSNDNEVRLWPLTAVPSADSVTLYAHEDIVYKVAFSPDGHWLASASEDGTVHLGAFSVGKLSTAPFILHQHESSVFNLAFSSDSHWLASASADSTIGLWDITQSDIPATGVRLSGHRDSVRAITFDSNNRWLVSGSDDATVMLWDLVSIPTNVAPLVLSDHEAGVQSVAVSPDGTWLTSGASDGMSQLWQLTSLKPRVPVTLSDFPPGLLFSTFIKEEGQPETLQLATGDAEGRVQLLLLAGNGVLDSVIPLDGQEDAINVIAASENGRWLTAGDVNGLIYLWQIEVGLSPSPLVLTEHENAISALVISPDNRWLISSSIDGTLFVWDLFSIGRYPKPVGTYRSQSSLLALAVDANSQWLAAGGRDSNVYLWNLKTDQPLGDPVALTGHQKQINALSFSGNGRWLASGSDDNTAYLWRLSNLEDKYVLTGHQRFLTSVTISSDNHWLATSSADGTVRLWNLTSANPSSSPLELSGHIGAVQSVAFSPDAHLLATTGIDQTIRLWDLRRENIPQSATVLPAEIGIIMFTTFSADSSWLATSGNEGLIRLWPLTLPDLISAACQTAGRNLTKSEWATYLQGRPYRPACPKGGE
jgi:WD40 repeat protein/transcriptional regulator with XRE-family HTH domain